LEKGENKYLQGQPLGCSMNRKSKIPMEKVNVLPSALSGVYATLSRGLQDGDFKLMFSNSVYGDTLEEGTRKIKTAFALLPRGNVAARG
jgi:hypothetical protein